MVCTHSLHGSLESRIARKLISMYPYAKAPEQDWSCSLEMDLNTPEKECQTCIEAKLTRSPTPSSYKGPRSRRSAIHGARWECDYRVWRDVECEILVQVAGRGYVLFGDYYRSWLDWQFLLVNLIILTSSSLQSNVKVGKEFCPTSSEAEADMKSSLAYWCTYIANGTLAA